MSLYPAAIKKLIPPGSNDPRITPRLVILHVAVSESDSLFDFFAHHSGGIESHFYVRYDGTVEQYRDTGWQADANYRANDFAISIETEGLGAGKWTERQLASIKALLDWCHTTHGIALAPCPRWDGGGVSYHSRYPEWSPVVKSCPGPARIVQYNSLLVPWMAEHDQEELMGVADDIKTAVDKLAANEANRYQDYVRRFRQIVALLDPDALADAIAAKIGGSADVATIKQAVKDALREGVE